MVTWFYKNVCIQGYCFLFTSTILVWCLKTIEFTKTLIKKHIIGRRKFLPVWEVSADVLEYF